MNCTKTIRINKTSVLILFLFILILYYFYQGSQDKINNNYFKNTNEINLRKLLIGCINAAQKGGIEVVTVSKKFEINKHSKGKTKEGAEDPITDADSRSHCVMTNGLRRIFPKLEIISEEDKEHEKCSTNTIHFDLDPTVLHENAVVPDEIVQIKDVTVWIDPLDATQEFTEKLYEYVTTMICVAINGKPIIGVIHNPFLKKTTWAWVDRSMSEDLSSKRDEPLVRNPIIIVSRSHAGDVKNISQLIFGKNVQVIPAGGAGYKVLQVVHRNATMYLHSTSIKKWDICAGNAILNALGGKMTDLKNNEIDYSSKNTVINDKGLLSSLNYHEKYIEKIMSHKILN